MERVLRDVHEKPGRRVRSTALDAIHPTVSAVIPAAAALSDAPVVVVVVVVVPCFFHLGPI